MSSLPGVSLKRFFGAVGAVSLRAELGGHDPYSKSFPACIHISATSAQTAPLIIFGVKSLWPGVFTM